MRTGFDKKAGEDLDDIPEDRAGGLMKTDLSARLLHADRSNPSEIARFDGRLSYSGEIAMQTAFPARPPDLIFICEDMRIHHAETDKEDDDLHSFHCDPRELRL
jgi:hypothetical protein